MSRPRKKQSAAPPAPAPEPVVPRWRFEARVQLHASKGTLWIQREDTKDAAANAMCAAALDLLMTSKHLEVRGVGGKKPRRRVGRRDPFGIRSWRVRFRATDYASGRQVLAECQRLVEAIQKVATGRRVRLIVLGDHYAYLGKDAA